MSEDQGLDNEVLLEIPSYPVDGSNSGPDDDQPRSFVEARGRKKSISSYETVELGVSFLIFLGGFLFEFTSGSPHQRPIPYQELESTGDFVRNQIYNEVFDGETVTNGQLMIYSLVFPFATQMTLSYFFGVSDLHKSACVYLTAFGLTTLLTDMVKQYVGYLRPIFYTVCIPNDTYDECTSGIDDEARRSFPSGHSSLAFCGLLLLCSYLECRFGLSSLRTWVKTSSHSGVHSGGMFLVYSRPIKLHRLISIACYAPILLAFYIATSRLVDNKHFPADVVGGSLLGACVARFVHCLWYPTWPILEN